MEAYESGELQEALKEGEPGFKKWLKALGKAQGRKGKRLFLPTRVALTGSMSVRLLPPSPSERAGGGVEAVLSALTLISTEYKFWVQRSLSYSLFSAQLSGMEGYECAAV